MAETLAAGSLGLLEDVEQEFKPSHLTCKATDGQVGREKSITKDVTFLSTRSLFHLQ